MSRRPLIAAAAVLVAAAAGVGIVQSGGSERETSDVLSAAEVREQVAGAPPKLAAVHRQANELLDGGERAFEARIRALRGHPVVVNVWGSWCVPCRAEFPVFQRVAVDLADRVAFLGIDTQDSRQAAERFLETVPVPYPSYRDFDGGLAKGLGLLGTPSTIFYDAQGERRYLHQGEYRTRADLVADIRRHTS